MYNKKRKLRNIYRQKCNTISTKSKTKNPKALISIKQGVEGTYGEEKTAEEHIEQIQITGEETTVIIQAKDPNDPTRIKRIFCNNQIQIK